MLTIIASTLAQAATQTPDPLSGGAGWVGAGLLGVVLLWLTFIHLPAKDKQLRELLQMQADERECDRTARHDTANAFQTIVNSIEARHLSDLEKDRTANEARNDKVVAAVDRQTDSFIRALDNNYQKMAASLSNLCKGDR